MDWLSMLKEIFEICIIPLLGILTNYLVKFIQTKRYAIATDIENSTIQYYVSMLSDTITTCVTATNQTYVDNLKGKNAFDTAAQSEAFQKTLESVKMILSNEAKKYLSQVYGDLDSYIQQQIEASVNENKTTPLF